MKRVIDILKNPRLEVGYLYFYIHLITEIICFYVLSSIIGDNLILWLIPFIYDAFAFVPQSLIGYASDKFNKINFGLIGVLLLITGLILCMTNFLNIFISVIILCLGNACIHVEGAEVTLRISDGLLSPSAIFVSGGSFGVIIGKLLASINLSYLIITFIGLTMVPFVLLANFYKKKITEKNPCKNFNYANKYINSKIVILLSILIVIVRGYTGYGIPTTWNKTVLQNILFYVTMGLGKALGGILSDAFGIKRIAIISIVGSLPFLLFGDNIMIISLIGIMLFSMTMSISLALLVSELKSSPGLAFGLTTIGLFLGTTPIFFFKINSILINRILITILSIICLIISLKIIKDGEYDGKCKVNI